MFAPRTWQKVFIALGCGGSIWRALGVTYIAVKTRAFREAIKTVDFRDA